MSYTYDLLGRMTGASQSGNALTFTYDVLGRQLTQAGPHGTVTSTYDIAGRRTRITHPDSFYVDQDYLVTGEMGAIRENGASSGVGVLATFAYDDLGRRTTLTRGNGTSTSYSYDAVSRLSSLTDNPAGTTHDQTLGFSYNPASQIGSTTRSNDLFAWTGHGSGNTSSTANGLNQITAIGGTSTAHDARSNMTADGLGRTFGYSSENLLTSGSGGVTASYDPLLRLYQIAGASTTRFSYDGADAIAEYNGSNALQRRFVHGPGVDEPLVWYEGSGTSDRRFLHADERGSIVAVSNGSGTVTHVNTYDEYGKPGSGNAGRFQYTGQKWIAELGLYDYKARMYHPSLGGRFVQTDPIGYGDGMNWYNYAGGDPINLADPWGLEECGLVTGSRIRKCGDDYTNAMYEAGHLFVSPTLKTSPQGEASSAFRWMKVCAVGGSACTTQQLAAGPTYQAVERETTLAMARRIADEELERTRRIAPNGAGHNDEYDAERHARWTYRMAREIDPLTADLVSAAHEWEGLLRGHPYAEFRMDSHNNVIGIKAYLMGQSIPTRSTPGLEYYINGARTRNPYQQ